ncbi:unnamed protein product [Somion occarium]|uniref:Uncharacterized protein n=1 Tax=Somion occarium TaxID=3059160 RepID=A0ABP1E471_9APHY
MASPSHQVVQDDSIPYSYEHPYLLTRSLDKKTIHIWSLTNSESPVRVSTLEGELPDSPHPRIFAGKYILTHENRELDAKVILIHKIEDGTLSDSKTIISDSNPDDALHPPIPGDAAFIAAVNGLIAIFKNGSNSKDSIIEVYGISEEGKLFLKTELRQTADGPELGRSGDYKVWGPTGYVLPTFIDLTEDYFTGAFGNHDVQLVKWLSPSSQPVTTLLELPATRFLEDLPQAAMSSWLNDKLSIPSSNSLILAHHEFPVDFVDLEPITAIRSVNPDTLELNWCSPIAHKTSFLRYNESLNVIVTFGEASYVEGEGEKPRTSVFVVDAGTGAVRKQYQSFARCDTSPSGNEIVEAFDDGRIHVVSLSTFLEFGFLSQEEADGGDNSDLEKTAVLRGQAFYPELEPQSPLNSKQRANERKAVARYTEQGKARPWVEGMFVGEGFVLLKGSRSVGFVLVRWK